MIYYCSERILTGVESYRKEGSYCGNQNGLLRSYLLFSCYRDGQELEAELGCLFAKTSFSSLPCLFVATVEDGFCVGFLGR
jgi:hypothetical protein